MALAPRPPPALPGRRKPPAPLSPSQWASPPRGFSCRSSPGPASVPPPDPAHRQERSRSRHARLRGCPSRSPPAAAPRRPHLRRGHGDARLPTRTRVARGPHRPPSPGPAGVCALPASPAPRRLGLRCCEPRPSGPPVPAGRGGTAHSACRGRADPRAAPGRHRVALLGTALPGLPGKPFLP